jgi:hypothetical protein
MNRLMKMCWPLIGTFLIVFPSGCHRQPGATGNLERPNDAHHYSNPSLSVRFDGFEQTRPAGFWLPGNYGSGLYEPGAIALSTNYARSGRQSVKITVHEGDVEQAGDGGTRVERAELDSGHFHLLGQDAWYGFSLLIPKDFPIVDTRLVIGSCKQSDVSRPIMAQRFQNGEHTLTVESQGRKKKYYLPAITQGKWIDMIYHLRYCTNEDGLVEVWMNGRQVVRYAGPTAEAGAKNAFYNKIGLYRDRMEQPMTIFFDNYTLGPDKESVDPARTKI